MLEQLSVELAREPTDQDVLRRFAESCIGAGKLDFLRSELDPVFLTLAGPLAVRPVARTLAAAISTAARELGANAPSEALELYLRAARVLSTVANDRIGAARALAAAWRLMPDPRVAVATQSLFKGTDEPPDYTLVALAEVGGADERSVSLRRLAANALERRRLDEAEELFSRLEAMHPGDPDVSAGREVINTLRKAAKKEVAKLKTALKRTKNRATRGATLRKLGQAQRSIGHIDEAQAALVEAVELDDPLALRRLEDLARETGRLDELCDLLARVIARRSDAAIGLKKRLFLLLEERGRSADAKQLLGAPPPVRTTSSLEEVREEAATLAGESPRRAALLLEEWADQSDDLEVRVSVLEEAASFAVQARSDDGPSELEERLWRKVRVLAPASPGAARFYREFYRTHPDPRRALANLAQLHALTTDAAERRAIATEMAALAEEAGELPKAIDAWRLVARDLGSDTAGDIEDPDAARVAVWSELRRLFAETRRWHAYVDLLDGWIEATDEVADKVELLFDMVEVYQDPERLPMPTMVLQTYQRIVALMPGHEVALDRLAVGLAEQEQWSELLEVLGQKVDLETDPERLITLFHQIADLYLDHIHSESQAVVVLERLLELDPDDIDVVRRLRELYRRRRDAEKHFAALERELELTGEGEERIGILEALADTAQVAFLQPERAVEYHEQILEIAPGREESLAALQALHAEQEDWPAYAEILEQRIKEAKSKAARLPLLLELGECLLTRLGEVERAAQIFQTIAESTPTSVTARRFLQRIFVARNEWEELARLYAKPTKTSGASRVRWKDYLSLLRDAAKHERDHAVARAIHIEIARVLEVELDDERGATEHLELALRDGDDSHLSLAHKLLRLVGEDGPSARRLRALEILAHHSGDPDERYRSWLAIGNIHRRSKDSIAACEAWGRALVLGAEQGMIEALPHLEEDAGATGRWETAYGAIEEALAHLPKEVDRETRAALHRSLGNIARTRLMKPNDALTHFRWVLQLVPGDGFALEELEKLCYSQNDFHGLEEVYRARIDAGATVEDRIAPLRALARLYDDVMLDPIRAAQTYQELLYLAPDDAEAFEGVTKALRAAKSWRELALALEAGLTRQQGPARRRSLQLQLVTLAIEHLEDAAMAIDYCRDIAEAAPTDDPALNEVVRVLERLADDPVTTAIAAPVLELVYRRQGRLEPLAELLEKRVGYAAEDELPAVIDEYLMLIGGVHAAPDKAYRLLARRFEVRPSDVDAWSELEQATALTNAWDELAELFKRVLEDDTEPPRLEATARPTLRLRLAEVYHRRLIELEEAIVETERALAETNDEREALQALELLEVLFKKTADLESFVRVKLDASRRVLARSLRRQKVIEAAKALAGALGRPEDAIAVLEPLWIEVPSDVAIADELIALHEREGDAERTDAIYTDAIDTAQTDERRDTLKFRRAMARRDKLGRWELAISDLIGLIESPSAGRDARRALLEVSRAQESEDQRPIILEVLIDYHERSGDSDGLINTLVVQAEFTEPGLARSEVLRTAASECMPELEDLSQQAEGAHHAFHLYGQALLEAPSDLTTLAVMLRIANDLKLWAELSEVLQAAVESSLAAAEIDIAALLDRREDLRHLEAREIPPGVRALLREDARIAEEELADDQRAIDALLRDLALADTAHEEDVRSTLSGLVRLYERVGDFEARRDLLQRMAQSETEPLGRGEVLEALALLELDVGRVDEAIIALHSGLEELTKAPAAEAGTARQRLLATLENIMRGAGRFEELVQVLVETAQQEGADDERRELLHRAAECAHDDLEDTDRAAEIYQRLVEHDATDEVAVARLVELHEEAGRWDQAIDALRRQRDLAEGAGAPAEAREIAFRIGQILVDHGGESPGAATQEYLDQAIAMFAEIIDGDVDHAGALDALTSIEQRFHRTGPQAREILLRAHRRRGDAAALAGVLERVAALDSPGPATMIELADLWLGPLGDAQRAWPHLARGYALDAGGGDGARCRERLLALTRSAREQAADPDEEAAILERLVRALDEVARSIEAVGPRLARRHKDLEAMHALAVGPPEIVPIWRGILQDEPKNTAVLDALEEWARENDDPAVLADALASRARALSPSRRAKVELELAKTLARVPGRQVEAMETYRALLGRSAVAEAAFDGLDDLLMRLGRFAERTDLLVDKIAKTTGERRERLRLDLASTHWTQLQDPIAAIEVISDVVASSEETPARAVELLESIWSEGAERPRVFRLLEPIYEASEDWDKLVALYMSTLEQDDPELQVECLSKLAELENVRLDKPEAAFTTLLALVERLGDTSSDATDGHLAELENLARRLDRWEELVEHLEVMVGLGQGGAPVMARLARIHEVERHDVERAAHFYRFAFERDRGDVSSRDALTRILQETERWYELAQHLLEAADASSTREAYDLRIEAAEVLIGQLEDRAQGLEVLQQVARDAPSDDLAFSLAQDRIADLLERMQDYDALHRHYREWIEQIASEEVIVELQLRLGRSLVRSPGTASEGLVELEDVLRHPEMKDAVIPALWSMIVDCERAEQAAARGSAVVGTGARDVLDQRFVEATAEAARLLEEAVDDATAEMRAGIAQAQLRVLPPGAERQATLVTLADLMGELGEPERAFSFLAEALRGDLENASIEDQLETIASEHGYWEALVGLYEECSAQEEERVSARYVAKIAHILHDELGQREEAATWFERHLSSVPGSREAVVPLAEYYRDVSDANAEARVLEQWIDLSATSEELPRLRLRLGVLRMDQLGDVQGAIDALEGCLPESAADVEFVRRLERLYVRGNHFSALVELYRAALSHTQTDKGRLETLAKMAQVFETRLDDATSARETAQRMLEIEPLNRFALTSLDRIERAAGDWDAVDEILARKLEATPAEAARVRVLIDRASVAVSHRDRPDEAIEHLIAADEMWGTGPGPDELVKGLEALLRSEPGVRRRAGRALERRYRARGAWQSLINVLMIELVASPDPGERFMHATQAVKIAIERLNDRKLALRVLLAALRKAPDAADLRALVEREAREADDFGSVLKTCDDMLRRGIPESALVGFALWCGALEQRHGDRGRAIKVFERVLEADPANPQASDALASLYRDAGDWAALRGIYNQRVAVEPAANRPALELDLTLHLARHEGVDRTIAAVEELLNQHPNDRRLRATLASRVMEPVAGAAATEVLAARLKKRSRWAELVKLLNTRAERTPDTEERSRHLREAAEIYEARIGDRVAAVRALAGAAEATPEDITIWERLREVGLQVEALDEVARVLRSCLHRVGVAVMAQLSLWLAELEAAPSAGETGRGRALDTLRAALEKVPDHIGLREAVVRLELAGSDTEAAEEEIAILTGLLEDEASGRVWWRALRRMAEEQGDDERAIAADEALLARDPSDAEAAGHLADLYRRSERWESLLEVMFLRVQAAQEADEVDAVVGFWCEIAELRGEVLGDEEGALEAWEEAWTLDATLLEATHRLVAGASERGAWQEVAAIWERHAEALEDPEARSDAYIELGRVSEERLRDGAAAVAAYEAALDQDPRAMPALKALISIHGRTRRFDELARVLERKAEAAEGRERALVYVQAAAVELDQLRNNARAQALLDRVLSNEPDHLEAQLLMARLNVRRGKPAEAAATLQKLAGRTEGQRKLRLLMDLARLLAGEVGELDRAIEVIEQALALGMQSPGLETLAVDIFGRAKLWSRQAELLEQLYEQATDGPERAERALKLARLYLYGNLADEGLFVQWFEAAREADPDRVEHVDALMMEIDLLLMQGDDQEVEPLLTGVLEHLEQQRAADQIAERSHQLGLVRERLGDIEGALDAFARAHEIDGKNVRKLLDYGRALIAGARWPKALSVHQALLMQRNALTDEDERFAILERLALASWEAGQLDHARIYLDRLLGERADHPGGLALRERFGG